MPTFFCYSVARLVVLAVIAMVAPQWMRFLHVYLLVLVNAGFLPVALGDVGQPSAGRQSPMTHKALLRRPGGFLGLFALVTALSLLAWDVLSAYYLQAIIWLVNGGLVLLNPATVLRLPASLLHDGVYLGIAGAIALFLVTPRQTWRWRLRWMGLLMAVMLALHAAVLLAETMNAIQGLSTAPLPLRLARTWGTSTVVIWVWFVAVRRPAPPPVDITPRSAGG